MLSLKAVLVRVSEEVAPNVRRELANYGAALEAEFHDAESAIAELRGWYHETGLLITQFHAATDLTTIQRLHAALPGWPVLVLVDQNCDPPTLIQLNRAGADQVVTLPLVPHDFSEALDCISILFGTANWHCQVIAVTPTQPGSGGTSIALNLAYEIATQRQLDTILIELAGRVGVLAVHLDLKPKFTTADLLRDLKQIDAHSVRRCLVRVADHFEVLAGPEQVADMPSAALSGLVRVIEAARALCRVLILDVPCTYDNLQFEALAAADQIVLVGEQSVSSVRSMSLVLDELLATHTIDAFHLVLNRYEPDISGITAGKLKQLLNVRHVDTIPNDRAAIMAAANQGKPLRLVAPRSPVVAAISLLVGELLGPPSGQPPRPPRSRFFANWFHSLVH
jgi:pilus assembly protein CpaE